MWVCAADCQNSYPIIASSVANYKPHVGHFWLSLIFVACEQAPDEEEFRENSFDFVRARQEPVIFCLCVYLIKPFNFLS